VHWLCIPASLLPLLGLVRGACSLAGFIPIGIDQVITRRLRPEQACMMCLSPQFLSLLSHAPQRTTSYLVRARNLGCKSGKSCTEVVRTKGECPLVGLAE
jgi:hypothetical protein